MPFYPQGWTHDRLLNASGEDLMALSETQRTTLFDGLKATHGEDGFREVMQEMSRRYRARVEAAKSEETKQQERELLAPFVQTLNYVFRTPETEEWGKWGFVVFRTTPYGGEHEIQWAEFRRRWDAVIEEGLAPHRGLLAKVDQAIDLLEFQWVEQPGLEGIDAAEVARRFNGMALPQGLATSACLMVTTASMESVLSSPLPSSAPRRKRQKIPFVVSVSQGTSAPRLPPLLGLGDEDVAGTEFKGYLNVAVETALQEFYPIVALQMMDLHTLTTKFRHENDIWCSSDRWGVHHYEEL
ncbi:hypothetical protein N7522_000402 [Penicillium canescens]|uniref:Uncharacterized protein n=1 Tax=Penicillium canescens TaxID=5083 RepID=A0AAD6IB32_PENCN|nr:uncharacterized protein N7446_012549 [Penicillium canescens]KAJ6020327.1 hypothetical protein N7522_000402 [Penicillium canescens]KAJ6038740.1 hypothetical protein N7460_007457 [Penicillium canescens]KAJ6045685.1 hypothetical protein N7446_012549 [Penicillium canescens]KAJ6066280.1 hypothetical protein N7444_000033 [Penicillium canescens]